MILPLYLEHSLSGLAECGMQGGSIPTPSVRTLYTGARLLLRSHSCLWILLNPTEVKKKIEMAK